MAAYYNEIDPPAAQWLRNLIARGLIAPGDVDERSILEVKPDDLRDYEQCHFFAGIGGWSYALRIAGYPDDRPVWSGSCPCQPFSAAGKQRGSEDERHLWPAFFDLIRKCRPASVFGEQVAGAAGLAWLDHVCADLEGAGYAAAAADLCAASVGAPHIRQRLYWVANADGRHTGAEREQCGRQQRQQQEDRGTGRMADPESVGRGQGRANTPWSGEGTGAQGTGLRSSDDGRCGLGNAAIEGLEIERWFPGVSCSKGGAGSREAAERTDPLDAWSDIEWIECSDGKARPTQRGLFQLAHGLPKGMVRGGDSCLAPDANESAEGRVMRLRGYGNAIVPQLAAVFVEACQ